MNRHQVFARDKQIRVQLHVESRGAASRIGEDQGAVEVSLSVVIKDKNGSRRDRLCRKREDFSEPRLVGRLRALIAADPDLRPLR